MESSASGRTSGPFRKTSCSTSCIAIWPRRARFKRWPRNYAVNFVPGSLYFFYGFRSLHGTDELDSRQVRANCLMNFGGPFFDLQKGKVIKYNGSQA